MIEKKYLEMKGIYILLSLLILASTSLEAKKKKYPNGDYYEGEWKNNMADGEGTLRTADGTKYKGHFVKGKEDGKGVLEDKNGVRYDGFFKQGKKHGAFVETDKNGNVIRKGVYKFGTLDAEQK